MKPDILKPSIEDLREIIERYKLKVRDYHIYDYDQVMQRSINTLLNETPINVGKNIWKGVLLPDEIYKKLGGIEHPTVYTLWTIDNKKLKSNQASQLIHNGRISLIGNDLLEEKASELSFGLIFLVQVRETQNRIDMIKKIRKQLYISNEIEGFQYRAMIDHDWFRISKIYEVKKISYRHIALAFLYLFKKNFDDLIQSIEVIIVGNEPELINSLKPYERALRNAFLQVNRAKIERYKKKRDDCEFEWGCAVCEYQKICNEIKEIIKIRKDIDANG